MALIGFYQILKFNPNRSDHEGNKITKGHLILIVVFFLICSISLYQFGFNTTERKEARYLNSIFKELDKGDHIIKESTLGDLNKTA
jgi:hypothetical protein